MKIKDSDHKENKRKSETDPDSSVFFKNDKVVTPSTNDIVVEEDNKKKILI